MRQPRAPARGSGPSAGIVAVRYEFRPCDNPHVLTTPLCRTLGIEHPVLSVGFGDGARPELIAAVSDAGGLGVLGLTGAPPDVVAERAAATRALTDRPFGANVILFDGAEPTVQA